MGDLTTLDGLEGESLSAAQIQAILSQIDLDVMNLLRDGKLAALKYGVGSAAGVSTDRAANLHALLEARRHYQELLSRFPVWEVSQGVDDDRLTPG